MKIIEFNIQGFRSLKDITWRPGDLNLIIGPNGSGKSNLLKALEMISISARGRLNEQVIREGGMEPLVWDGQVASQVGFLLLTSSRGALHDPGQNLAYQLQMTRLGGSSAYRVEHEVLAAYNQVGQGEKPSSLVILERTPSSAVVYDDKQKGLIAPPEMVPQDETLLSQAAGPYTANRLIASYQKELSNWAVYHQFQTHRESVIRQPAISRTERLIAPDGNNLIQVLHTLYTSDRNFKRDVNLAMDAVFGKDFEELTFPPDVDQRVQLKLAWRSLKRLQTTADLSDGTLRFLYLIAILANPVPPALVAIDEPELGLHPSMLPVIAEYARDASRRTQLIIATHSAEFLDAFNEFVPTVTVAKWVDGQTYLNIPSGEDLSYWLQDYTLGKLFRSGELEDLG